MKNKQLFEKYIAENLDNAYRFAYTFTKNQCDAEDIVSESVVKALAAADSIKNPQYIKPWFYRIISNTAVTFLKSKKRFQSAEEFENDLTAEDDYSEVTLMSIINNLDLKYRETVVLRFLENMRISEIAEVTGVNENTVKTRLYRALELLKTEMESD